MSGIRVAPGLKGRAAFAHGLGHANPAARLLTNFSGDQDSNALSGRIAAAMADAGAVDTLRTDTGESLFRLCSGEHHHHLVCRECGRTVEVTDRAVEAWSARTAAAHGFTDATHTLEIFGRCADCG